MQSVTTSRITWIVGFVLAFALISTMVYRGSYAALSATTVNEGNAWSVFGIRLTDNDSGSSMFNATNILPGAQASRCITVTYDGDGAPDGVRLYAAVEGTDSTAVGEGQLPDELDMSVTYDDTAGIPADCTGFASDGTLANAVALDALEGDYGTGTKLATGGADWQPADGEARTFQFTYELPLLANPAVQGDSATSTFTFEAQKS